ncbi:MAG: hypothetical protein EHM93_13000 [Bacteroidales bacterium]|nr:MAG: hypothetical protein EHM93_13000 [Bacteroidales bacterium]
MKKTFSLVGVLLLASSTLFAQELTLDDVLNNYYKASGFDKLQQVNTIIMSGMQTTHVVMPAKIYKVRPNKVRMERDVNDITGLTVYDGQTGWTTAPWSRNPNPQIAAGPILIDILNAADFDGILYNWKAKDHNAELVGKEAIDNTEVYRIKFTRKDGGIEFYLIDSKAFLLQRKIFKRMVRDKEMEVQNVYSDYKPIEGVMFAFTNETLMGGQVTSSTQYESIEVNKPVDDKLFLMPAAK